MERIWVEIQLHDFIHIYLITNKERCKYTVNGDTRKKFTFF